MWHELEKRFVSALVSTMIALTLVLPVAPMSVEAADASTYKQSPASAAELVPKMDDNQVARAHVVKFGKKDGEALEWYVIGLNGKGVASAEDTLTLLAKAPVLTKTAFSASGSNTYSTSGLKASLDAYVGDKSHFTTDQQAVIVTRKLKGGSTTGDKDADYVSGDAVRSKLWPLSAAEAKKLDSALLKTSGGSWWLRSPGAGEEACVALVDGAKGKIAADATVEEVFISPKEKCSVRPAMQLDLSGIAYDAASKTLSLAPEDAAMEELGDSTYTVTLDNQGATTPGAASVTATYNAALPGIEALPAKDGAIFGGYYSETNGSGTKYLNADGTATDAVWTTEGAGTLYARWITREAVPDEVTFTATGDDSGTLSNVAAGMKYRIDEGDWTDITGSDPVALMDLSACTILVIRSGDGTNTTDSDPKEINVTKGAAPTTPQAAHCQTTANTDGKLTGVTADMEYKTAEGTEWTAVAGEAVDGLAPGTYYVRTKANGTALASDHTELTIKSYLTATVVFKVVNGSWDDGEGDAAAADRTVTLEGNEGELMLTAAQIPAVGNKPINNYKAGAWDETPDTETDITENTTYTYTYAAKEKASVTTAPAARELTYNGEPQALVTAGEAVGGELMYAPGDATGPTGAYSENIPTAIDAGTYGVYYMVAAGADYLDSEPAYVEATIGQAEIVITAENKSSKYREEIVPLTYTASSAIADGDNLEIALTCEATSTSEAGEYPITISWNQDPNYTATLENGTYTISYEYVSLTFDSKGGSKVDSQQVVKYKTGKKPADPTRDGYAFDKWYADEALKEAFDFNKALTKDTTVYAGWTTGSYFRTNISGTTADASHTWSKGATQDVVITVKNNNNPEDSFQHFSGVMIDNAARQKDVDYTVKEGSTIVTLKGAMLEKLTAGAHTVTLVFDNGQVDTAITVKAAPTVTPTSTPRPTATATPKPTATSTPRPTATSTPRPTATATPRPTATSTPRPTATKAPTSTPRPTATKVPTATVKPTATPTGSTPAPKTGDTSNIWLWVALLAASAIGLAAAFISRRKN